MGNRVVDAFGDIRRIQGSAVDDGRESGNQLNRCDTQPLSKCNRRLFQLSHRTFLKHNALAFSGQINARFFTEAEFFYKVIFIVQSHTPRYFHKAGIGGIFQHLQEGLLPMTSRLPGFDTGTADHFIAAVVIRILKHIKQLQLQCRSEGYGFKGGAGLIALPDWQIAVIYITGIILVMIRIEVRLTDHGQNFPGIRIHRQSQCGFRLIALDQIVQLPLHDILNIGINGQLYIHPSARCLIAFLI